jgi:hypothetical protein
MRDREGGIDLAVGGGTVVSVWRRQPDGTYEMVSWEYLSDEDREAVEAFGRDLSSP